MKAVGFLESLPIEQEESLLDGRLIEAGATIGKIVVTYERAGR